MGEVSRRAFSVAVFARHGGEVLLVQHRRLATWLPVGGEIEPGETPLEAARRELAEETGLAGELTSVAPWAVAGTPPGLVGYEEHEAGSKGLHMNFVFVADVAGRALAPCDEWSEARWVKDTDGLACPENVRQLVRVALAAAPAPAARAPAAVPAVPPPLFSQELYTRALRFATEAHHGQKFPGTELPYLMHVVTVCMEVTAALAAEPRDPAVAALAVPCALLHDVVEDTPVTEERVRAEFGPEVAAGVRALSKDPDLPKQHAMADSLARIQAQPHAVWMVKLADRIANLGPPPAYWKPEKRRQYRVEAEVILAALGVASPFLAARLRARIAAYRRHEAPPPPV